MRASILLCIFLSFGFVQDHKPSWIPTKEDRLLEQYKHVYVEWTDIVATDTNWRSKLELDEWIAEETVLVRQSGFLYKETDEYIVLIDSYMDGDLVGAAIKIPRCVIKKLEIKK